jgi:hypothetical protein
MLLYCILLQRVLVCLLPCVEFSLLYVFSLLVCLLRHFLYRNRFSK